MQLDDCNICGRDYTECRCLEDVAETADRTSISSSTHASEATALRGRHWCFTINNPTENEKQILSERWPLSPDCGYMVWQTEEGEEGTRHIQGYVEFTQTRRLSFVKRILGGRAHLERRRGTRDQARTYCMKGESRVDGPFEFGTWRSGGPGRRCDLQEIRERIDAGAAEMELWENHFNTMVRNYRAVREYRHLKSTERDSPPVVHVLYGDTGTGKSRWAQDTFPNAYWKSQDAWWDGYDGQECVIFDEFYGWIKFSVLLRICDRYPLRLERKCGFINFTSKTLIFTSNHEPDSWYQNISNFNAFIRRVTIWHYMPALGEHHTVTNYDAFKRLITP